MELGVKDVINFDQLVRIFVDTDVDTHFIVSLPCTSTVAELRELVKTTHSHCYPESGDVYIGKLAVPGGDYGYLLADYLRIGQVYDRYEGKVFAEVEKHDPARNNGQELFRLPALRFKSSFTPKIVPLLASQSPGNGYVQAPVNAYGKFPLSGSRVSLEHYGQEGGRTSVDEPGVMLAAGSNFCELRKEVKAPKLQKETLVEDTNLVKDFQGPLDQLSSRANGLPEGSYERMDEEEVELVERPGIVAPNEGVGFSGAYPNMKLVQDSNKGTRNPEMCAANVHKELGKVQVSQRDIHELLIRPDIGGVWRKRNAFDSNEKLAKSQRLSVLAPSGSTSKEAVETGRFEIGNGAIDGSKIDKLNLDCTQNTVKNVNELTAASLLQINRSGDIGANLLFTSLRKRKNQGLRNLHLKNKMVLSGAMKDGKLGPENKKEKFDDHEHFLATPNLHFNPLMAINSSIVSGTVKKRKKKRQTGTLLVNGSGIEGSAINCLEVDREDKSVTLLDGSGVLVRQGKERKKQKQESKQRKRKDEVSSEVSVSLNSGHKNSDPEPQQEEEQFTTMEVIPTGVDPVDHLGVIAVRPSHSYYVLKDEEDGVNDAVKGKKKKRVKKKGSTTGTTLACDVNCQMGYEVSQRPSVLNISKDDVLEDLTPYKQSPVSKETSGECMIQTGALTNGLNIHHKVPTEVKLSDDHIDAETGTYCDAGAMFLVQAEVTKVNPVESQECPNLTKRLFGTRAGRGAPSETRNYESFGDVTKEKDVGRRDTKIGVRQSQSSPSSEKRKQQSEGINVGIEVSATWLCRSRVEKATNNFDMDSLQGVAMSGKVAHSSCTNGKSSAESGPKHIDQLEIAKPGEVAHSSSSTGHSSAAKLVDETEVRSQQDVSREEDQILRAPQMCPTSRIVKSPEKHAITYGRRSEGGRENVINDSVGFFSQEQSFHVTSTQVIEFRTIQV